MKNSLQHVAELLVLSRPDGVAGAAFDETAGRIRSIAAVHQVLEAAEGIDAPADEVVRRVVEGIDPGIVVTVDPVRVPAETAQRLGVVTNELVTNAVRHGRPPVTVGLSAGSPLRLEVGDAGPGYDLTRAGLGLQLTRQVVEHGLDGRIRVERGEGSAMVTLVEFDVPTEGRR